MIIRIWILTALLLVTACAADRGVSTMTWNYEEDQEDVPDSVTASPVPCLFFKW
jgi:hypothetical protein